MTVKSDFLASCGNLIPNLEILIREVDISANLANVSGFSRKIIGSLRPSTVVELSRIVEIASATHTRLYPFSRGRNWGLGSKLPCQDGAVLVDLSKMNKVRELNLELGYAVIEPGVTQAQLAELLRHTKWFVDVTGSSPDSSIIGNALERGMSYSGLRVEKCVRLEVIDGRGQVIETGFPAHSRLKNLYRYGLGPSVEGLFFQSNLGIVTALTLRLEKRHEHELTYTLSFGEKNLPEVLRVAGDLLRDQVLSGMPHVFNHARLVSAAAPLLAESYDRDNIPWTADSVERDLAYFFKDEWFVGGAFGGPRTLNASRARLLKKALSPFGVFRVTGQRSGKWLRFLTKILQMRLTNRMLKILEPLGGVAHGEPSSSTLKSLEWASFRTFSPSISANNLDDSNAGAIYLSPLCPNRAEDINRLLALTRTALLKHNFPLNIALNLAHSSYLEGVLSLHFDKTADTASAHQTLKELMELYEREGFSPYRSDIESMAFLCSKSLPQSSWLNRIKDILDPNQVLSPGRYEHHPAPMGSNLTLPNETNLA